MKKLWLPLLVAFLFIGTANAATFTVDSILDGADVVPGDGFCSTSINRCSLRAAIEESNANATTDIIAFAISGAGVKTIVPASALPDITEPVTIDGWTQGGPGYTGSPLIELDGTNAGAASGLSVEGGNSLIRGLIINRFEDNGITLSGFSGGLNRIQGCYIGTDATGTIDLGNEDGIYISSDNNLIGGSIPAHRNVISGNSNNGIFLLTASQNIISGNYIGTNASGTAAIGNDVRGIYVDKSIQNRIGGTTAGERNVISANKSAVYLGSGIGLGLGAKENTIIGNYIGTDANGSADLGNSRGISTTIGVEDNKIGGALPGEGNTIAFNDTGILLSINALGNSIRGNSIFSNSTIGIDLSAGYNDGVTLNDTDDPDNRTEQSAKLSRPDECVHRHRQHNRRRLAQQHAEHFLQYRFYSNALCGASGYGEGEIYIGSQSVTTDAGGDVAFTFTPASPISQKKFITSTATRTVAPLDTSEFSECVQVVNGNSTVVTNTADSGAGSLRQAILNTNALPGIDTIKFNIPGAGVQTINLLSALPVISDSVIINGTTQPGYNILPLIELNGAGAGAGTDGLDIQAGLSTVKGLVINRFGGDGIRLTGDGGNTIINCFIGTNAAGTLDRGNNSQRHFHKLAG